VETPVVVFFSASSSMEAPVIVFFVLVLARASDCVMTSLSGVAASFINLTPSSTGPKGVAIFPITVPGYRASVLERSRGHVLAYWEVAAGKLS